MTRNICITTNEFWPAVGGVGVSVDRISRLLLKLGYGIHIVHFDAEALTRSISTEVVSQSMPQTETEELDDGRIVHRVTPSADLVLSSPAQVYQQFHNELVLLQRQYAFVLFHSFYVSSTGFVTGLVAKEAGVPFIASVRGNDLHLHIYSQRLNQIMWTLANADVITCVTSELSDLAQRLSPCSDRVLVIYNSIDPDDFVKTQCPDKFAELPHPVIGASGVFKRKKGLEYFLAAGLELKRSGYQFTPLLIGYPASAEQEHWSRIFRDCHESLGMRLTGQIPHAEMLSYLSSLDIYIISSVNDGFPNCLLEAMLVGLPIIGTKSGAMQEILENGKDALLVQSGSVPDLVGGIKMLLNDEALRRQLGQSAYAKAVEQFSPKEELLAWKNCYGRVLD